MMWTSMRTTFRIACLSGLLAISAWAQLTQGFISGTVTDPTGAVVPSVSILLTETSTGVTRRGTTNQAGVYRFVGLEPVARMQFLKRSVGPFSTWIVFASVLVNLSVTRKSSL